MTTKRKTDIQRSEKLPSAIYYLDDLERAWDALSPLGDSRIESTEYVMETFDDFAAWKPDRGEDREFAIKVDRPNPDHPYRTNRITLRAGGYGTRPVLSFTETGEADLTDALDLVRGHWSTIKTRWWRSLGAAYAYFLLGAICLLTNNYVLPEDGYDTASVLLITAYYVMLIAFFVTFFWPKNRFVRRQRKVKTGTGFWRENLRTIRANVGVVILGLVAAWLVGKFGP